MNISKSNILKTILLSPLSVLWENIYKVRRSFYEYGVFKKDYFKVPIISVGNITFGGTGKTPMIVYLTQKVTEMDLNPVVLTRGYKGDLEHESGIIKGGQRFRSNPKQFGDEPLLISRKMERGAVIVGKKRAANLKKYFHEVSPDVVFLDDGFQHIQLYRSLNIVLFDSALPLERYKTAPLGYLREGLTALKDADIILMSRADQVEPSQMEKLSNLLARHHRKDIPIGKFGYKPDGMFDSFDSLKYKMDELEGRDVIALTAIASPDSFYRLLEDHGANIVEKVVYPDHYLFTQDDMNDILIKSTKQNALVITSEKDMVKVRRVIQDARIVYVNISVSFIAGEEEVMETIKKVLHLDSH
jgi:tetraacyldisaccharide 4'-kinase